MEKFIVSARKYRPQNFATVVGQSHITTTLKNAIQHNTLAHAFLFCGPRGVGKTTCARILAKTINCENLQPDGEACNQCRSCQTFNDGTSLNIIELDAASNNGVDEMRDLTAQLRFVPPEGKYRIYIIDEVHMLSSSAFNAFLKTLEEPPAHVKFILATTEKHKILPTILSRCQIFDFKRITNNDTVVHLQEIAEKEHIQAEKAALQLIAQKSEGCMRDSLSLLDKIVSFTNAELTYSNTLEHLNLLDEDYYFKIIEALQKQDLADLLLLYDEINRKGFEGDAVLNGFAECLRNLMVSKDAKAAQLLNVLEGMQNKYVEAAKGLSLSYLVSALNVLTEAESSFRLARNKRLHVELCFIKLCYLQQALEMAVLQDGQVIKNRRVSSPVAVRSKPVEPLMFKTQTQQKPAEKSASLTIVPASKPITERKLDNIIEQGIATQNKLGVQKPENTIVLQSPALADVLPKTIPTVDVTENANISRSNLLHILKQEQQTKMAEQTAKEVRKLNLDEVKIQWNNYTQLLKDQQKHSAVTSFNIARLEIYGNEIIVKSVSNINQKFLESEATPLLEQLKVHFNNLEISLKFLLDENENGQPAQIEPKYLSSQERYRMMVMKYPLVKELKEKLKLELKY